MEQTSPAVLGPVEPTVRPRFWARRDQVEKAKTGGYLCAMYPNTDGRTDLQPMYDLDALEDAIAAERERCAEVCERMEWIGRHHSAYIDGENNMAGKCAAAIRGVMSPKFMQAQFEEAPDLKRGA